MKNLPALLVSGDRSSKAALSHEINKAGIELGLHKSKNQIPALFLKPKTEKPLPERK